MKKLISIITIIALITSQQAQADLAQRQVGLAAIGTGSLGVFMALATGTAIIASGGLALAAVGGLILISSESNPTKSSTGLSIHLNPNEPLVTPPNWIPPVPPAIQPTAPNTAPKNIHYEIGASPTKFTSHNEAALSRLNVGTDCQNGGCSITLVTVIDPAWTRHEVRKNGTFITNLDTYERHTCPTGYNINGTFPNQTCTTTTPQNIQKPKMDKMQVIRTGNTFQIDPKINTADIIPNDVVSVTSNKVTANHADGSKTEVTINTDGTSELTVTTPQSDNTTKKVTSKFSPPDTTGNVTTIGTSQQITDGTGTLNNPNTGNGTTIDLPTDYNRETTQQDIKTKVTEIADSLKCDDCELPEDTTDEDQQKINDEIKKSTDMLEDIEGDYGMFKDIGWTNWVPTFPTSTCSPISGTIANQTVTWDLCPHIAKLNELIGWLMNLFGAWTITGMFFRRD